MVRTEDDGRERDGRDPGNDADGGCDGEVAPAIFVRRQHVFCFFGKPKLLR